MAIEREPPRAPPGQAQRHKATLQPVQKVEFGKPSILQSPLRSSVFNIPKPNHARPEHHRSKIVDESQKVIDPMHGFRDPFLPKPSAYTGSSRSTPDADDDDSDLIEIPKPANASIWSSYAALQPTPTYSSLSQTVESFSAVNATGSGKPAYLGMADSLLFADKIGSGDSYEYVDAAKANEKIKALLEGAFEDEDDKPKTRGRRKRLEQTADGLFDKLKGLDIGSINKLENKKEEEEEEEDEYDGTVEGLTVKLLPHQSDGVEWMKGKEIGTKKIRGVLPKGGILADDVSWSCALLHV